MQGFDDYARVTGKPLTVPPQHSPNHWSVAWRPSIMKRKPYSRRKRTTTKSILCLPDLEHAKAAVLNSLTSADAQRGYRHAIDEFVDWYCSEPRLAFNRTVVLRYRSHRLALIRNDEDLLVDVLRGWLREPPRGRED